MHYHDFASLSTERGKSVDRQELRREDFPPIVAPMVYAVVMRASAAALRLVVVAAAAAASLSSSRRPTPLSSL